MVKIYETYSEGINAITHPVPHHADEVFATAILSFFGSVRLYRTRDKVVIDEARKNGATIYDVGGEFDPEKKLFDHHQRGFSETRPDGTKYASTGLLWREYGARIVKKLGKPRKIDDEMAAKVVARVDETLIKGIDARDNGQATDNENIMSVSSAIALFNPLWDGEEDSNECFLTAYRVAERILARAIESAISYVHGRKIVDTEIRAAKACSCPIVIFDRFVGGWRETILENPEASDLLFAIFPTQNGDWAIQAIPPDAQRLTEQKKPFPEPWRGLKGDELAQVSGVTGATFCHLAGFFAVADSKKAAIELAKIAATS